MNNLILVGNPNVGKTTLFNTLTKSNDKATNWHGVTVGIKSKKIKINDSEFNVVDIPGLYSLDPFSNEEKIACDYLCKHKDDLIINICDANNLKRNLLLTKDLIKNSYNVVLVINMINEVKNLNIKEIEKELGIFVLGIDARKNKSVSSLKTTIFDLFENEFNANIKFKNLNNKIENIDRIINKINNNIDDRVTRNIDKIILNKFLFFPIFFISLFFVFYITFGEVGDAFSSFFNELFLKCFNFLKDFVLKLNISNIIKDFLILGVLSSVLSIMNFLPRIILLMMLINILEDIGFMSRVAFMFDGILKKIGLSGKSLFSIMMGYGCTTSAILTTRNLENYFLRKKTSLILPFTTCSAKLPIFLTIASLFFDEYKYLFVFGLYLFSIFLLIIFSYIYKKILPDKENTFILEMPKYRFPYIKKILKDSLSVAFEFIYKVGTTILIASIIFWILQNFSFRFKYLAGENFTNSILYTVSNKLQFIFKPIGLNQSGIIAVLIFGLIAKELIIVGLSLINGTFSSTALLCESLLSNTSICYFTKSTSIIFLLFVLIYTPCISALSTIKSEFNLKTAIYVFIFQFLLSYLICFLTNMLLSNIHFIYYIVLFFVVAIVIKIVLKLKHKKICKGNCNACRKI